ncbi:MAG TPA: pyridoxamine 5'-phosphate oxidase, partial [Erythrobacter sp.]|nr:pyridoxamine 5'-phosphate oxidase [Erythrobacter sp.]
RVSQIGSAASDQSRALPDRQVYLDRVTALEERYPEGDIPRPPHWTGFRLSPRRIEFWQDRQYRLHDRRLFVRDAAEEAWSDTLLYP